MLHQEVARTGYWPDKDKKEVRLKKEYNHGGDVPNPNAPGQVGEEESVRIGGDMSKNKNCKALTDAARQCKKNRDREREKDE